MNKRLLNISGPLQRILPFLRGRVPLDQEQVRRVLIVGSGSIPHIRKVIGAVHTRFPKARLVLMIWHSNQHLFYSNTGLDETIAYQGLHQALALWRQVANLQCDVKVVLFTAEGQVMLKLLAFFLPARRMLVYTEGGGSFEWDFDQRLAIWNHIKWRLGGGSPLLTLLRRLGRSIFNPLLSLVAFILLLLWHGRLMAKRMISRRRLP